MTSLFRVYLIFIFMSSLSLAGSIPQLEKQLERETAELILVQKKMDSLQVCLENYSHQIEMEKSKGTVNQKKIADWYERIEQISRSSNSQRKNSHTLEQQIIQTRHELDRSYARAADSLQDLSRQTSDQQNLTEINRQILAITEKRLSILPAFHSLSFDPQKISGMSLQHPKDSLEFAIYLDYLTNARREVQAILYSIQTTRQELDQLLLLQQRSNRFLEELEENRTLAFFSQSAAAGETPQNTYYSNDLSTENANFVQTQAQSLLNLLNQLPQETKNFSRTAPLDSSRVYSSLKEYRAALKDAEKLLQDYQKLIDYKINSR